MLLLPPLLLLLLWWCGRLSFPVSLSPFPSPPLPFPWIPKTLNPHQHRAAEYEADAIGIHLLAKACYDPDANITMLQKLDKVQKQEGIAQPEMLSTHPLTQVRVCVRVTVDDGAGAVCAAVSDADGAGAAWCMFLGTEECRCVTDLSCICICLCVCSAALSTYPRPYPTNLQERVQRVRALLPEAYALRQQYCARLHDVFDSFAELFEREAVPLGHVVRGEE